MHAQSELIKWCRAYLDADAILAEQDLCEFEKTQIYTGIADKIRMFSSECIDALGNKLVGSDSSKLLLSNICDILLRIELASVAVSAKKYDTDLQQQLRGVLVSALQSFRTYNWLSGSGTMYAVKLLGDNNTWFKSFNIADVDPKDINWICSTAEDAALFGTQFELNVVVEFLRGVKKPCEVVLVKTGIPCTDTEEIYRQSKEQILSLR